MAKFLVLWSLQPGILSEGVMTSVLKMSDYANQLKKQGKLHERYHVIGKHGGAWIYDTTSHEELDRLLAMAPVYNYAHYEIFPLAEMENQSTVVTRSKK